MRPPATPIFWSTEQQSFIRFRVQRDYCRQLKEIIFQQSQSRLRRQSMRRGKASQHSVRLTTTAPQQSSWPARRDASPYRLQQPHDAHAMSIPPQSCSLYPEEKRAPCLRGLTRPFFAQRLSGSLDRVRRKARSTFCGNSHKQATLAFELHGSRGRSNGDGTFFPTNLQRHPRLYPGFATNVFWNNQSSGMVNGCFKVKKGPLFSPSTKRSAVNPLAI